MKRLLSIVLLGALVAGCQTTGAGGGGNTNANGNQNLNANAGGQTFDVTISDFAFTPKSVTVHVGDTVVWTNDQIGVPHTVTSGNPGDADAGAVFDSGTLASGATFTHTFTETGTFTYFCEIHGATMATMRDATVIVEP
jgi:plastocyanin